MTLKSPWKNIIEMAYAQALGFSTVFYDGLTLQRLLGMPQCSHSATCPDGCVSESAEARHVKNL